MAKDLRAPNDEDDKAVVPFYSQHLKSYHQRDREQHDQC